MENSHVLPALIRRFHHATEKNLDRVVIWGTGKQKREFLHVDDMAAASLFVLDLPKIDYQAATSPMLSHINVGCGNDISILDLALMVANIIGYKGDIVTDVTKPDGAPRKLMDVSRLTSMGWQSKITLKDGIQNTYNWFLQNKDRFRD